MRDKRDNYNVNYLLSKLLEESSKRKKAAGGRLLHSWSAVDHQMLQRSAAKKFRSNPINPVEEVVQLGIYLHWFRIVWFQLSRLVYHIKKTLSPEYRHKLALQIHNHQCQNHKISPLGGSTRGKNFPSIKSPDVPPYIQEKRNANNIKVDKFTFFTLGIVYRSASS